MWSTSGKIWKASPDRSHQDPAVGSLAAAPDEGQWRRHPKRTGYPRTRTASAANAPRWTFGPPPQARGPTSQTAKRKRGDSQHARNEVLEHAVGELDDAGFHGPSLLDPRAT